MDPGETPPDDFCSRKLLAAFQQFKQTIDYFSMYFPASRAMSAALNTFSATINDTAKLLTVLFSSQRLQQFTTFDLIRERNRLTVENEDLREQIRKMVDMANEIAALGHVEKSESGGSMGVT